MSLRVVFMGTSSFAVPALEALKLGKHDLATVVTQADRPVGRGRKFKPSPVKDFAQKNEIPIMEPTSCGDQYFLDALIKLAPQVIVLVAYGQMLPKSLLGLPRFGCLNLHPSLLPKYRGAAPIPWAILNGERVTGVTIFRMNERMDAGDILLAREMEIARHEDARELSRKLSEMGAKLLLEALEGLESNALQAVPQSQGGSTYAPELKKVDGKIDWRWKADRIERVVRALVPWPGAYTHWRSVRLKIHKARAKKGNVLGEVGEVMGASKEGLLVQTGEGYLDILEMQPENRPTMSANAFLQGHKQIIGDILGDRILSPDFQEVEIS